MVNKSPNLEPAVITLRLRELHDFTNQPASKDAAMRRRMAATQTVAGPANNSRHHIPRRSQS